MKSKNYTIQELFNFVLENYWSAERYKRSGHRDEVIRNYQKYIAPYFAEKKASKITKLEVKQWHQSNIDKLYMANRALEVFTTIYNKAIEEDLFNLANPCAFVKAFKERSRKRYATADEIRKIGTVLFNLRDYSPVGVAFLLTLLFTGARPRSLERARWEDLSVLADDYKVLSFHGKSSDKTGEDETVIFPKVIMTILEKLPRRRDGLIFGIKLPRDLWSKVRKAAGCEDLWARDLRRTFATVGLSNGVKIDKISELLNHKSVQTTKIYAKLWDVEKMKAAEDIASRMADLLNFDQKKVSNE